MTYKIKTPMGFVRKEMTDDGRKNPQIIKDINNTEHQFKKEGRKTKLF